MKGGCRDAANTEPVTTEPACSRTVLVVEDEAVVALFLADVLADLNYEVCGVAPTGRKALALAAERRPHIAMVDLRLKGDLDGFETARKLDEQFDIRSVLLSGDPEALRSAASRGVSPAGVLNKPYTPEQLETVLARAFAAG
jgi:two-component system, response regulator PdtaR